MELPVVPVVSLLRPLAGRAVPGGAPALLPAGTWPGRRSQRALPLGPLPPVRGREDFTSTAELG